MLGSGEFYLYCTSNLTSSKSLFYLPTQPAISNHGLETTVYRPFGGPLIKVRGIKMAAAKWQPLRAQILKKFKIA